jgi:hypothetical protein
VGLAHRSGGLPPIRWQATDERLDRSASQTYPHCPTLLVLLYGVPRLLIDLLILRGCPTADRDLELLMLRQELIVLRRTSRLPRWRTTDRLILAALGGAGRTSALCQARIVAGCIGSRALAGSLPSSLVVLGEWAVVLKPGQVYTRFGVRVTVVEALDRVLRLKEPEAGAEVARDAIEVHTGVRAIAVTREGNQIGVSLENGQALSAERLPVATGRRANLDGLRIENVGVDASGWICTDPHLRAAKGVWAVGDATGEGAFTHAAMYQAAIAPSVTS